MKSDREMALTSRDRLKRMKSDKDEFLNMLRGQRKEMFKVSVWVVCTQAKSPAGGIHVKQLPVGGIHVKHCC